MPQRTPGLFRKLDALAVLTGPLLPVPQVLEESRGELRGRAERAEQDLDTARAELAEMRRADRAEDTPAGSRRRRTGQTPQ